MTIAVESQFKQLQSSSPKKNIFSGINGIRARVLCVCAAVLYQVSYEDPIIGANFAFQNRWGLTIKSSSKHQENSLKKLKTSNPNSLMGLYLGGLFLKILSERYLHLKFGGLIFGRAYFWGSLLSEFYGIHWYSFEKFSYVNKIR